MYRNKRKGIALIAVIVIIAVSAIAVFGIATFISNALVLNTVRSAREQAIYAAQAGIYACLYDYKADSYWTKVTNFNPINNLYYSIGKNANFLLIDASNPQVFSDNVLRRIPLANINNTQSITANTMKVEWYNIDTSGFTLGQVWLGGTRRFNASASSGQTITLNPAFLLTNQQSFSGAAQNRWVFSNAIPNDAIIIVTFFFTDGSSRKANLLNLGRSGNNEFSITSTGTVRDAADWKRSIEATYDVEAGKITSWQETENHI